MTDYCPKHQSFRCTPETLSNKDGRRNIEDWLMSLRQDFPVSRFAPEGDEPVTMTNATLGPIPSASLTKSNHNGYFWRIPQSSYLLSESGNVRLTSIPFSETWPQSGMMRDGVVYPLPLWEPNTNGNGCGLLPTPVARDGPSFYVVTKQTALARIETRKRGGSRRQTHWVQYSTVLHDLKKCWANPRFSELMMGWPIGWTDLKPLDKASFQQWLRRLGG